MHVLEVRNDELMDSITRQAAERGITYAAIVALIGAFDSFTVSTPPASDPTSHACSPLLRRAGCLVVAATSPSARGSTITSSSCPTRKPGSRAFVICSPISSSTGACGRTSEARIKCGVELAAVVVIAYIRSERTPLLAPPVASDVPPNPCVRRAQPLLAAKGARRSSAVRAQPQGGTSCTACCSVDLPPARPRHRHGSWIAAQGNRC